MFGKILNNIFGDAEISSDSKLSDASAVDNLSMNKKQAKIQPVYPIKTSFKGNKDEENQYKFGSSNSTVISINDN